MNVKQVDFARDLGISTNYVNLLVNNKKSSISSTLSKLIEQTYGYSADWIISGNGEKIVKKDNLTSIRDEVMKRINKMSDDDVKAVLAYAQTLEGLNYEFFKNARRTEFDDESSATLEERISPYSSTPTGLEHEQLHASKIPS